MKKIVLSMLLSMIIWSAYSQQLPQFSYFTYNYIQYNPAVTGNTECLELKLGARRQWTGLEGAPSTGFASVHGRFGKKKFNYHGIGAVIENDKAGPFSYTGLNLNYAYHMRMRRGYMLSSGLGLGFKQYRVNFSQITMEQQDIDPVIQNNASDFIFPVVNFGLWLYNKDRFYGVSMRQMNKSTVEGINDGELLNHWTLAYGRSIKMTDDLAFKPAFLLNYVAQSKASLEAQAILSYREKVAFGIGGRSGSGMSALLKIDFLGFLTAAYAYDLTLSKMRFEGGPTHEFILGIKACGGSSESHTRCAAYD
jgi:type IX secretion system PorP/SprF family membrane protein